MLKRYRKNVNFEKDIQPHLKSSAYLYSNTYDLKIVRMMIFTKDGGSLLLDFKSEETGLH